MAYIFNIRSDKTFLFGDILILPDHIGTTYHKPPWSSEVVLKFRISSIIECRRANVKYFYGTCSRIDVCCHFRNNLISQSIKAWRMYCKNTAKEICRLKDQA